MKITHHCVIRNHSVYKDGEKVFSAPSTDPYNEFIKSAYKHTGIAYPKFYKMDNLSKLAFVAAEVLLKDSEINQKYAEDETGLVIQNFSSTLDVDREHQNSISNPSAYFPSPAIFVYTLPNIMMGEICIRHAFRGENLLLITEHFSEELLYGQLQLLFAKNKIKACIAGYANIENNNYDCFFMLVEHMDCIDSEKEFRIFARQNSDTFYNPQ